MGQVSVIRFVHLTEILVVRPTLIVFNAYLTSNLSVMEQIAFVIYM